MCLSFGSDRFGKEQNVSRKLLTESALEFAALYVFAGVAPHLHADGADGDADLRQVEGALVVQRLGRERERVGDAELARHLVEERDALPLPHDAHRLDLGRLERLVGPVDPPRHQGVHQPGMTKRSQCHVVTASRVVRVYVNDVSVTTFLTSLVWFPPQLLSFISVDSGRLKFNLT